MRKKPFKRLVVVCAAVGMLATSMSAFAAESYTVQDGDNLKKIAKQLYGDSSKWEVIYEANKGSIKNPNLIYEGQVFAIPDSDAAPAPASGAETPAPETVADAPADTSAPVTTTETPAPAPLEETPVDLPQIAGKTLNIDLTGDPKSHVSEVAFRTAPDAEWMVITPTGTTPATPMSDGDRDMFYIGTLENYRLPHNYLEIRVRAVLNNGERDNTEYIWFEDGRLFNIPSGSDCSIHFDHIAQGIFVNYYNNGELIGEYSNTSSMVLRERKD
ncbi:MAG: LysM peptidoglycan-binding domain-containing protein [Lachnospiraceae bacterium]|nr:LysM peptidoglycan-binding domain-containing protein [Lachnospiraceae bacterium]